MANVYAGGRVAILAMIVLSIHAPVRAQTNAGAGAEAILKRAYVAVVEAELARAEQRTADAVSGYRNAVGLFGRLQAEYPGWREDMVSFRVADCQNVIALLESAGGTNGAAVAGVKPESAEARLNLLVQELKLSRAWLLDGGGADASKASLLEQEIRQVRAERDRAVRQAGDANRKVAKLEARLRRFDPDSARSANTNTPVRLSAVVRSETMRLAGAGQYDKALELLRECVELFPERRDLDILAGVTACRAGRFDLAIGILKPYESVKPGDADALLTMGTAWMGLGRIGEARVATEKALELNPESAEAHYNMAQIFLTLRPAVPVEAEKHYLRARELGLEADADFENNLRTAFIISRLKKRLEK